MKFASIHFLVIAFINASCLNCYADTNNGYHESGLEVDRNAAGSNVTIDTAANGVPVVNINDPNSAGVSHNKFIDFNVGTQGVILNNSQVDEISKIGGAVFANPNLTNNANTIINEVTSTRNSKINGPTEILGQAADYILANPNGISVNGIEFINAHKVTLTTGLVQLNANGALEKLIVDRGTIDVNSRDLNLKNIDYFDIVSHVTKLNAKIHAGKEIKIITGKNSYDVKTSTATSIESNSRKAELAIDSSSLGGLYAGKIKIIGNEQGVGVNLPDIAASTGDIEITASGNITHNNLKTPKELNVKSTQGKVSITEKKLIDAKGNIAYSGNSAVEVGKDARVVSTRNINIDSKGGSLINNGKLVSNGVGGIKVDSAGLSNSGTIYAKAGAINQTIRGESNNTGKIITDRELKVVFSDTFTNAGLILAKTGIDLEGKGGFINLNKGRLESKSALSLTVDAIENKGIIFSSESSKLKAIRSLINVGTIKSQGELRATITEGDLTNLGNVIVKASAVFDVKAIITNTGLVRAERLKIISEEGSLNNTGLWISAKEINLQTKNGINNKQGTIKADTELKIVTDGSINNSGEIIAVGSADLRSRSNIKNSGLIEASNGLELTSSVGELGNSGDIYSPKAITITTARKIENDDGVIKTDAELKINTEGDFNNSGEIIAIGSADITAGGDIYNSKLITAGQGLTLASSKGLFDNSGEIYSPKNVTITANKRLKNNGGLIKTNTELKITTNGDLNNSGEIIAVGSADITANGDIKNSKLIAAKDWLKLISSRGLLDNSGNIYSVKNVNIDANQGIVNKKTIKTDAALKLITKGDFNNSGSLHSLEKIEISAIAKVINSGSVLGKGINIDSVTEHIQNYGGINSGEELVISAKGDVENLKGNIVSLAGLQIISARGNFKNTQGMLDAEEKLLIKVGGSVNNTGGIFSEDNIEVNFKKDLENNGVIYSPKSIDFKGSGDFHNGQQIISTDSINIGVGGNIKNDGEVESGRSMVLKAVGSFENNSKIRSFEKGDFTVDGNIINTGSVVVKNRAVFTGNKFTNKGKLNIDDKLEITAKADAYNSGEIKADNGLTVKSAGSFVNEKTGKVLSLRDLLKLEIANNIENGGHIESGKALSISADKLTNEGDFIAVNTATLETGEGGLSNKASGHIESSSANLDLKSEGALENYGTLLAKQVDLLAESNIINKGSIESKGSFTANSKAGKIENVGEIKASGLAKFDSLKDFDNANGVISADGNINIDSKAKSINSGNITSKANLEFKDNLGFENLGYVGSDGALKINSQASISNPGIVFSKSTADMTAKTDISNIDGRIEVTGDLKLTSKEGGVTVKLSDLKLKEERFVTTKGKLVISSLLGINNDQGHIESAQEIDITTADNLDNSGHIISGGSGKFQIKGDINNKDNGHIQTAAALDIFIQDSPTSVKSGVKSLTNSGSISAGTVATIIAESSSANSGLIQGSKGLTLKVNSGKLTNDKTILTHGEAVIEVAGDIENNLTGVIKAKGKLNLKSETGSFTNNGGKVTSEDDLIAISAKADVKNDQGHIESAKDLTITATTGSFTNNGERAKVISFGKADITVGADFTNTRGRIEAAGGDLTIKAAKGTLTNEGEILSAAKTDVTVKSLVNTGQIQGEKALEINSESGIENKNVLISGGMINLQAGTNITNKDKGTIQAASGEINSKAGEIINEGKFIFEEKVGLIAKKSIANKGSVQSKSLEISTPEEFNNSGEIKVVDKISIKEAAKFTNSNLIEFGEMDVSATSSVENKSSASLKGGNLTVKTKTFDNAGSTNLTGKITVNVDKFTSNDLVARSGELSITGDFENTKKMHFKEGSLAIKANSINNKGEFKVKDFKAAANTTFENSGMIFASDGINLIGSKGFTNTGNIISKGSVILTTNVNFTNSGAIYGAKNVHIISDQNFTNSSKINSSGSMTISSNSISNNGEIAGKDNLSLTGALTNYGHILTNGALTVDGKSSALDNRGTITSHGSAAITSAGLTNNGVIQAVGSLKLTISGNVVNSSSIYGRDISLSGSALTNSSRIIARDSMAITTSGNVTNASGAEISVVGKGLLSITAANLYNRRNYSLAKIDSKNLGSYIPSGSGDVTHNIDPGFRREKRPLQRKIVKTFYDEKLTYIDNSVPLISSNGSISIYTSGSIDNTAGKIFSQGNTTISGSSLNNQDIIVERHTKNDPIVSYEHWQYKHKKGKNGGKGYWKQWSYNDPEPSYVTSEIIDRTPSLIQARGSIYGSLSGAVTVGSKESGGGISPATSYSSSGSAASGNFSEPAPEPKDLALSSKSVTALNKIDGKSLTSTRLDKTAIAELAPNISGIKPLGPVALSLSKDTKSKQGQISMDLPVLTSMAKMLARTYDLPAVAQIPGLDIMNKTTDIRQLASRPAEVRNNVAVPDLPEPQPTSWNFDDPEINAVAMDASWSQPSAPGRYYITETSPVFTNLEKYFSTDNFIKRIPNYNPKKDIIHYGDPMKQMDFVRRQMVELTGLMSLDDEVDYVSQMQKLYESGERLGTELKIAPGITLTASQVERLQDDLVWPEIVNIDGAEVLVPRLYLAKNKSSTKAGGLLAKNIHIEAESFHNTSSIIGSSTVSLTARSGDIINRGGTILAGEHLSLSAEGNISNIVGGQIASDGSATLSAQNIYNITEVTKYGGGNNYFLEANKGASIGAAKMLTLSTRGDVKNVGSSIKAGSLTLSVGGSFVSESIELGSSTDHSDSRGYYRGRSVVYKPSTLEVEGDVNGIIEGNFALIGSKLKVGGNSTLLVGGDTLLASQVASHQFESQREHKSGRRKSKLHNFGNQENLVESGIEVGGRSILFNKGNQTLIGAKLSSADGTQLKGEKVKLLATETSDARSQSKDSKNAVWQSSKNSGHDRSTVHTTSVTGGIEIDSGDIEIETRKTQMRSKWFGNNFASGLSDDLDKPAWMRQLEARNGNIKWTAKLERSENWNKSQSGLTKEASAVVSIAAAAATAWCGGFGGALVGGLSASAVGTVAMEAAITHMASRAAVSAINNRFDVKAVAKDVTSKESLRDMARGVGVSTLTFGITEATGLGKLEPGMSRTARFQAIAERGLVRGAVSSAVTGDKLRKSLEREASLGVLAMGQSLVGDIGVKHGLADGGAVKTGLHALVGGAYSGATTGNVASGVIGGGLTELMMPSSKLEEPGKLAPTLSAIGSFVSGGSVKDIETTANISQSAIQHNSLLHLVEDDTLLYNESGDNSGLDRYEKVQLTSEATAEKIGEVAVWAKENPAEAVGVAIDLASVASLSRVVLRNAASQAAKSGISTVATSTAKVKPSIGQGKKTGEISQKAVKEGEKVTKAKGSKTAAKASPLLPNEGRVDSYKNLKRLEKPGDNLTPHHIPSAEYMKKYGIKNTDGISIMVEQPHPGVGGRHRKTSTYGRKPNLDVKPRTELAKDILDLRTIYKEEGVYTPGIREGLQEVIKQNKEKLPIVFKKD